MILHLDAQKKAQEELDKVCQGRLPDYSDRPSLPYLDALCVELTRWAPIAPLGGTVSSSSAFLTDGTVFGSLKQGFRIYLREMTFTTGTSYLATLL